LNDFPTGVGWPKRDNGGPPSLQTAAKMGELRGGRSELPQKSNNRRKRKKRAFSPMREGLY
jgi:hypothetical protein